MSTAAWIWLHRLLGNASARKNRLRRFPQRRRTTIPHFEPLEAIALLSANVRVPGDVAAHVHLLSSHPVATHVSEPRVLTTEDKSSDSIPVTSPAQTVSLGTTLTNFANEPLSPALNLFDPSLGTLLSVAVSYSASIQGNVMSQNRSTTSATVISASLTGSYQVDGLNQPISQPTKSVTSEPMPAGVFGSPTDTVVFPPLLLTNSSTTTFTDPTNLAFFTGSSGRTAITLTMTATGASSASAPNGNLMTTTLTSASASVSVNYTYVPACPTVAGIGRIGLHHQRTQLIVTFEGPVDPAKAGNPNNYTVITSTGEKVPITSATFNPATNSVTLIPARRLNVHLHYRLSLVLPCPNETNPETEIIPFGSRKSLIGFEDHHGQFVSVQNGRINGFYNRYGQFIPIHNGKIEVSLQVSSHDLSAPESQPLSAFPWRNSFYWRAQGPHKLSVPHVSQKGHSPSPVASRG
jgi:hypothetical protein